MATLVQTKDSVHNDIAYPATVSVTFDTGPTQGNLLLLFFNSRNIGDGAAAVVLPAGWSEAVVVENATVFKIGYKIAGSGEPSQVAVEITQTLQTASPSLGVAEYSGDIDAAPLDKVASANSGAGSVTSQSTGTTATTTQADELLIAAIGIRKTAGDTGSHAFTNSFTIRGLMQPTGANPGEVFWGDRVVTATSTYESTGSWTTSYRASGGIATFKVAPAAAGSPWYAYAQQ
jgi:hypothetical protein